MNTAPVILFDMDDTLAATSPHWRKAETALLTSLGHAWDAELAKSYKGMNALDIAAVVYRTLSPADVSKEDCQAIMRNALTDAFTQAAPQPMQGSADCVRRLALAHRMAVASGSPMHLIELTLNHLQIMALFELRLSSESVPRGKPHPDVFLAAAAQMNVAPKQCMVIEDSLIGAQAARAAGMRCIVIPSSDPAAFKDVAHRLCNSLDDVNSKMIREVMAM